MRKADMNELRMIEAGVWYAGNWRGGWVKDDRAYNVIYEGDQVAFVLGIALGKFAVFLVVEKPYFSGGLSYDFGEIIMAAFDHRLTLYTPLGLAKLLLGKLN